MERLAQYQIGSHIESSPNFGSMQSAYRACHSTETAMVKVVNNLLSNTDSGLPSVLMSLDISAAFDTLQHTCFLTRAENLFGLTSETKEWLSNRSSYVALGDQRFSVISWSTGVPCNLVYL